MKGIILLVSLMALTACNHDVVVTKKLSTQIKRCEVANMLPIITANDVEPVKNNVICAVSAENTP